MDAPAATIVRALAIAIVAAGTVTMLQAQDDDLDVLIDRLATYLEGYERELTPVIADEHYVQEERRRLPRRRVTESQVLLLRPADAAQWFGIRDTGRVDGRPVARAGLSLLQLLEKPPTDFLEQAGAMVEASAAHSLAGRRNINIPTVPLEALSPVNHPRYVFKVGGKSKINGAQVRRLDFHEFDEPTLVQSVDGGALWTSGSAWVEVATGTLWRAELIVSPRKEGESRRVDLESRIRVDFMRDPSLDMLVPKELVETFWIRGGQGYGRGRYSNFRKVTLPGLTPAQQPSPVPSVGPSRPRHRESR